MDKKRERGKNYTEADKSNMLEIVKQYINIIENKQTDIGNVKCKNNAWDKIALEYNSVSQTGPRNAVQLKLLYETIKKKVKKNRAEEKMQLYKTGGGPEYKTKVDPIGEKFLEVTNNITDIEIINPFDSSSALDKISSKEPENASVNNNQEFVILDDISFINDENSTSEIIVKETPPILPTKKIRKMTPNSPYFSKQNKYQDQKLKSVRLESEKVKLDILKIRLEKEEIERDLLKLQKREKELELKSKYPNEF